MNKEMSKWAQMYKSRVGESYPDYVQKQYQSFIGEICGVIEHDSKVLEAGCGIATISKVVGRQFKDVSINAIDIDIDQVSLATQNVLNHHNILVNSGSILDPRIYEGQSIIHSHGVLEHFEDSDIAKILGYQKEVTKVGNVIHYVPLEGWVTGSYGDERLLSLDYWMDTFRPIKAITFTGGKDAVLVW